jgi:hypothetical protein
MAVPIENLQSVVADILTKFRAGVGQFSRDSGSGARIEDAVFTLEVIVDGDEVLMERQTTTQDGGTTRTTTTEQPFSETTTTVKSGSYTQAGSNSSSQGGGSSESTDYTYDEAV